MALATQTQVKRHPIRGAIYGLLTGIGAAVYLVIFSVTPFSVTTTVIAVVIGVVVGILWGLFAPAKKQKDMPEPGATYDRVHDGGAEPPPSYEDTFADTLTAPAPDDGAFGAVPESSPDDPPTPV